VTKDVPDHALMLGVPARQAGWVCKCGLTLKISAASPLAMCASCGETYSLDGANLIQAQAAIAQPAKPLHAFSSAAGQD